MSNRGLPEAESDNQAWMQPPKQAPLPRAGYSDFNPPPISPKTGLTPEEQTAKYTRLIYRFLVGAAIGGIVGVVLFLLLS